MSAVLGRAASPRAGFLRWLRTTHAWLGLWGAAMGLFFGATGIVMNHRAILKLPLKKIEQTTVQLDLAQAPRSPEELARVLQDRLDLRDRVARIRVEPAQDLVWNQRGVRQPERWHVAFDGARRYAQAEYWVGNITVKVTQSDANAIATLTRLHQAIGVDAMWVLVADTIAGSFMLLALTGLVLWSQLRPWRLASFAVALGALGWAAWSALSAL